MKISVDFCYFTGPFCRNKF